MKKFLLGVMLVIASSAFSGVYIDEGFESGTLDNFTVTDVDGDGNNWQISTSPVNSGTYSVESVSDGMTPDNELLFPSTWMELDAFFNFWIGGKNTDGSEHYEIYIANDRIDPSNFILVHEETLTTNSLSNVEISLRDYFLQLDEWFSEGEISIKIRHYNTSANSAGSGLVIDDFRTIYYPTYSYDPYYFIIPFEVVEPYSSVNMRWAPYDMTMYDYLGDWSFIGLDNLALHYILRDADGSSPEETYPLITNTNPEFEGTYLCENFPGQPMGTTMEYWVEAADNSIYGYVGESQHFFVEWGEINFNESFDGYDGPEVSPPNGWMPDGWITYQTGTVTSSWDRPWEVDVATQNVHGGTYSVTSASQNNFGEWLTENYLVSPRRRINGTPTLKYYANAQTKAGYNYRERWTVLISTVDDDGTNIDSFVELKRDSIIPVENDEQIWYEKTLDLSPYQDQYVRIMWKHNYTSTIEKLDRFLNIDDISIAEMPVMTVDDPGNAAIPGEGVTITAAATDYSGIHDITIHYTLEGQPEALVLMTDNGDGSYTGVIPGQSDGTKCTWYAVVTDNSAFFNTTSSQTYDLIWFNAALLEWGSNGTGYADSPEPMGAGTKAAIDWNFATKGNLYLNQIEVGLAYDAPELSWKLVEFDPTVINDVGAGLIYYGAPTNTVIGNLQGTHDFKAGGDEYKLEGYNTPLYGHVALEFDFADYNELMLDESGDKSHAWQWSSVSQWTTNNWGAFYIKMYVSLTPNGIEEEFVSSTTELCQNYPNPFNPTTSISFYNRIAGDVSLTVYNVKGENVATLLNKKMAEGFNRVDFNASSLNSGVYYYTLRTPEKTLTKKMVLVK